jgi:hypothetical protein
MEDFISPVFRQSERFSALLTSINRSRPRIGLSSYRKATHMISHRVARILGLGLSWGLSFSLSGALAAAEPAAGVATPNADQLGYTMNLLLADAGTTKKPHKKGVTPKNGFKRKSTKSLHGKSKSVHGKTRSKKGTTPHRSLTGSHQVS